VKIKILVLYDDQGKKTAAALLRQLKKLQLNADSRPMEAGWRGLNPSPDELFAETSHIVTVFSPAAWPSWAAFTAGFALGKALPLVGYPAEAGSGDSPSPPSLIPIRDQEGFGAYFSQEKEAWPLRTAKGEAKFALLDMGIPFSEESFAQCISGRKAAAAALFLEAGFSPDARDKTGVPLLCLAARAGDRGIVKILLEAGAQVNMQALDRGSTALIDCASGKHSDIMADLLAAGADVNLKSKDGQSALIIAVGLNDAASAEMLLKAGANPDEPDSLGASARKYAALFNKPLMVELFKTHAGA
jgi:hypothetical protein